METKNQINMSSSDKQNLSISDLLNSIRRPRKSSDKQESNTGLILGAALAGFCVGCTAALLFTPESGSELREDISKILHETNEKLISLASDAMDRVQA